MPSDPPIESDVIRPSEKSEETGDILRRSGDAPNWSKQWLRSSIFGQHSKLCKLQAVMILMKNCCLFLPFMVFHFFGTFLIRILHKTAASLDRCGYPRAFVVLRLAAGPLHSGKL